MQVTKNRIILVVFLVLSVAPNAMADDQQLRLEIGLSKSTFLVAEPIWLDAMLTNVSGDTVRISMFGPPCHGGLNIELKEPLGRALPYTGPRYNVLRGPGFILDPQEQYYGCFNLLEFFNMKRSLHSFFWQILLPGSYKVRASYQNICSQEIEFQVVEPTENEKEAYQLLEEAKTLMVQKEFDLERQKLQELINRFPNSVYAEKAHKELGWVNELLQRFPNSGYNGINLKSLTRELVNEKKQEFLEKVIQDHPATRSAKYARQMLARPELVGD